MTTILDIACLVADGKLPASVSQQIVTALKGLCGKRIIITIKEQVRPRSLKQNKFYQGPFIESFRQHLLECGQRVSHDDIHSGLRDAHAKNAMTIMLPGDVPFRIPPSTARLTTSDFEGFLEEIRAEYAARLGWQLPFPGEYQ